MNSTTGPDVERAARSPGGVVTRGLGALVPTAIARRSIDVSIGIERRVYERGEPVPFSVTFRNRLPVAVSLATPTQRRWGWTIDGHLEGTTESRTLASRPAEFAFGARETRRIPVEWNGRIRRAGSPDESVVPDAGEYELSAFLATENRPSDSTIIRLR
ncbi:hypothetical protein [Halovivax limisalsi]|uniref:hypothetical protein n=1 Tax=Halovivax limisalsi TaxID=1453760 RepID=UPI001FFCF601|nr:hypothetical protein [Halovivax limisalsi]